jgi:hypothetical protein
MREHSVAGVISSRSATLPRNFDPKAEIFLDGFRSSRESYRDREDVLMFDAERLLQLGLFNQVIPIWQIFFFIFALLPFLLMN